MGLKSLAQSLAGRRVSRSMGPEARAVRPGRTGGGPGEARMAMSSAVNQALGRLQAALARVESAVERSLDQQREVAGLEDELQRLGTDRSRLAQSLDASEERSGRMEDANREVSRRLVAAMESIRDVLARNGEA
jgi:chromosome segregation ATPase